MSNPTRIGICIAVDFSTPALLNKFIDDIREKGDSAQLLSLRFPLSWIPPRRLRAGYPFETLDKKSSEALEELVTAGRASLLPRGFSGVPERLLPPSWIEIDRSWTASNPFGTGMQQLFSEHTLSFPDSTALDRDPKHAGQILSLEAANLSHGRLFVADAKQRYSCNALITEAESPEQVFQQAHDAVLQTSLEAGIILVRFTENAKPKPFPRSRQRKPKQFEPAWITFEHLANIVEPLQGEHRPPLALAPSSNSLGSVHSQVPAGTPGKALFWPLENEGAEAVSMPIALALRKLLTSQLDSAAAWPGEARELTASMPGQVQLGSGDLAVHLDGGRIAAYILDGRTIPAGAALSASIAGAAPQESKTESIFALEFEGGHGIRLLEVLSTPDFDNPHRITSDILLLDELPAIVVQTRLAYPWAKPDKELIRFVPCSMPLFETTVPDNITIRARQGLERSWDINLNFEPSRRKPQFLAYDLPNSGIEVESARLGPLLVLRDVAMFLDNSTIHPAALLVRLTRGSLQISLCPVLSIAAAPGEQFRGLREHRSTLIYKPGIETESRLQAALRLGNYPLQTRKFLD